MSTTRSANKTRCQVFKERRGRTEAAEIDRLSQAANPISGQSDSGVDALVNKKRKLSSGPSHLSPASLVLPLCIHVLVREY